MHSNITKCMWCCVTLLSLVVSEPNFMWHKLCCISYAAYDLNVFILDDLDTCILVTWRNFKLKFLIQVNFTFLNIFTKHSDIDDAYLIRFCVNLTIFMMSFYHHCTWLTFINLNFSQSKTLWSTLYIIYNIYSTLIDQNKFQIKYSDWKFRLIFSFVSKTINFIKFLLNEYLWCLVYCVKLKQNKFCILSNC